MKIALRKLHKAYRDADKKLRVIDDVDFDFPDKGALAIVGRSGVGKSTLLHLLGGLDRPSSGQVLYGDTDLAALSDEELSRFRGKTIGFIFQFHHLLPEFDAVENVAMPLIISGQAAPKAKAAAKEVLARVNLQERFSHRPGELSGGEQQRVAIARALVAKPAVILADEPTGNLDVSTANEVQKLLLEINRDLGNILIVVTHNKELAQQMHCVTEMQPGGKLLEVEEEHV